MNTENMLSYLQNMANATGIPDLKVFIKHTQDRRKTKPVFFIQAGQRSFGPVLDYTNMNHLLLGMVLSNQFLTKNN